MSTDQLNVLNQMNYVIVITDVKGNVINAPTFASPPVWGPPTDPSGATVAASADGTTAVLTPGSTAGPVINVTMNCTIGTVQLTASDQVTIIAGPAANASIVGTPSPAPGPGPTPVAATIVGTPTPKAGS